MVYVDRGEFMTEPIIQWLNKKRSSSAGWGATVDTLLATESMLIWSAKFGHDFQKIEGTHDFRNSMPRSLQTVVKFHCV